MSSSKPPAPAGAVDLADLTVIGRRLGWYLPRRRVIGNLFPTNRLCLPKRSGSLADPARARDYFQPVVADVVADGPVSDPLADCGFKVPQSSWIFLVAPPAADHGREFVRVATADVDV